MPAVKKPHPKPAGGPIDLSDALTPEVYLKQFVEWLKVKPTEDSLVPNAPRTVHLRLAWLHAPGDDSEGVVNYGEIGHDADSATMTLGVAGSASDMKVILRGKAALYSSAARWGNPPPAGGLSGLPFPFNPNAAGEVTVTIRTQTGQIDLDFADGKSWTIQSQFQAGANLLWGIPSGAGAPAIKPMVLLSLSKHGV